MGFSFNRICSNVIPAGTYKVQITDVKFKTSATGAASNDIQVHYAIVEGAYAKRTFIDTLYEKAFSFRLKPFLKACGIDMAREFDTARELYEYGIREAKGKVIMVELGTRTYNGNEYNDVKSFAPLPGSTTSAEDVAAVFGTDVEAKTGMPEMPSIPEEPAYASTADVPTTASDDEIPQLEINAEDAPF